MINTGLLSTTAYAHTVGVSQGKYQLVNSNKQTLIQTELFFARSELSTLLNLETVLTEAELGKQHEIFQKSIIDALHINTEAERCNGKLKNATLVEADGIYLNAEFFCYKNTKQVSVKLDFLANLSHGHRHVITSTVDNEESTHNVAYLSKSTFKIESNTDITQHNDNNKSFFTFGLEHILTGYDHLLFLFALILMPISLKQVLFSITAFTLAHSITLGISVLGFLVPNSNIIEPLIALSIAYVGIENFIIKKFNKRWILTFLFGLIHGFGFAGALHEISLSTDQLPWVLLNFNLGVEMGQVLVILMVFPILAWFRKSLWFNSSGIATLNMSLIVIGSYWFIDRSNFVLIQ
jgi:hydrogenase/urease accessory protein HupE